MKAVDVRVKALVTFSDSQSMIGLRRKDEEFVTTKERADYLNGLNETPLVVVLDEIKILHSESVSESESESISETVSESESESISETVSESESESISETVSELASELASEVVTTRKPRRKTSKESE
ncbi:hypothetical protein P7J53_00385 [Streptococcus suis]|uniref:hypothetical protein n=1 Tax=Streptococcus suis TaxID=1307 RepID=UPI0038BC6561